MLDELDNLENKKLNWNKWLAKKFTKGVIWTKHKLGLRIINNIQFIKELEHLIEEYKNDKVNINKPKFNVGDRVRIYSYKTKFDKGSKPNWTREIFIISHIKPTDPIT